MSEAGAIPGDARPRLPRGVRLKQDEARGGHVLLAPERVVRADAIAVAVLERCDGTRTLDQLVAELSAVYNADPGRIEADVRALLADLAAKRMLDL
jgi:pyrroloquinoline quinone biosynthesis protein D